MSICRNQHLLLKLDAFFSTLDTNQGLYADHHAFLKDTVITHLFIILRVVDSRRFVSKAHTVHSDTVTAWYIFIGHRVKFFGEFTVSQPRLQQFCIALYLLVGRCVQPSLFIVRLGVTNP